MRASNLPSGSDYAERSALELAGVDWVLQPSDEDTTAEPQWTALSPTAPRARLVTELRSNEAGGSEAHWNSVTTEPVVSLPEGNAGEARVVEDRPGLIVIDAQADSQQLLVTTESFDSLWFATVDGRDVTVVRVDGDFLGCVVPEGKHRVRLEFRPKPRQLGALFSCLGLGLLIFAACIRVAFPWRISAT